MGDARYRARQRPLPSASHRRGGLALGLEFPVIKKLDLLVRARRGRLRRRVLLGARSTGSSMCAARGTGLAVRLDRNERDHTVPSSTTSSRWTRSPPPCSAPGPLRPLSPTRGVLNAAGVVAICIPIAWFLQLDGQSSCACDFDRWPYMHARDERVRERIPRIPSHNPVRARTRASVPACRPRSTLPHGHDPSPVLRQQEVRSHAPQRCHTYAPMPPRTSAATLKALQPDGPRRRRAGLVHPHHHRHVRRASRHRSHAGRRVLRDGGEAHDHAARAPAHRAPAGRRHAPRERRPDGDARAASNAPATPAHQCMRACTRRWSGRLSIGTSEKSEEITDGLDLLEMSFCLERHFKVSVEGEDFLQTCTVASVVAAVIKLFPKSGDSACPVAKKFYGVSIQLDRARRDTAIRHPAPLTSPRALARSAATACRSASAARA